MYNLYACIFKSTFENKGSNFSNKYKFMTRPAEEGRGDLSYEKLLCSAENKKYGHSILSYFQRIYAKTMDADTAIGSLTDIDSGHMELCLRLNLEKKIRDFTKGLNPDGWALKLSEEYMEDHNRNLFYFMTSQALKILPDKIPAIKLEPRKHEPVLPKGPSCSTHLE